jgi:hypothetical protein
MATQPVQEIMSVRTRVNLGAIFAGAVVSLAVYLLLSLLGMALGLSISAHATDTQLGLAAAGWALATLLIALFCGGFLVSQCTVGETTGEAAVYGVIMWGLVIAFLLWLTTTGTRLGFNAALTTASTPAAAPTPTTLSDEQLAKAGFSKEVIAANREYFNNLGQTVGSQMRAAAENPQAIPAAWWTFAGVLFSMLAAMIGAVCGSGPQVVVAGFPIRARFIRVTRREAPVSR